MCQAHKHLPCAVVTGRNSSVVWGFLFDVGVEVSAISVAGDATIELNMTLRILCFNSLIPQTQQRLLACGK